MISAIGRSEIGQPSQAGKKGSTNRGPKRSRKQLQILTHLAMICCLSCSSRLDPLGLRPFVCNCAQTAQFSCSLPKFLCFQPFQSREICGMDVLFSTSASASRLRSSGLVPSRYLYWLFLGSNCERFLQRHGPGFWNASLTSRLFFCHFSLETPLLFWCVSNDGNGCQRVKVCLNTPSFVPRSSRPGP